MRKTKIICTLGPSSDTEEIFTQMCGAGLNVARLNFSHGTYEEHQSKIDMVKKVRERLDIPIAIMLDTKGPEYRIKTFENGSIELKDGDTFTFTTREIIGNKNQVSVNYENLTKELEEGDTVLVNNGLVIFTVTEVTETDVICKVVTGGTLSDRKSMSFPGKVLNKVYLSEQDKEDLLFGIKNEVDYVAASFVSSKADILSVKNFLAENGGDDIGLIAKIENRTGINNIEEICSECDGIMIARGDLGVEIPFAELPAVQKYIIENADFWGNELLQLQRCLNR